MAATTLSTLSRRPTVKTLIGKANVRNAAGVVEVIDVHEEDVMDTEAEATVSNAIEGIQALEANMEPSHPAILSATYTIMTYAQETYEQNGGKQMQNSVKLRDINIPDDRFDAVRDNLAAEYAISTDAMDSILRDFLSQADGNVDPKHLVTFLARDDKIEDTVVTVSLGDKLAPVTMGLSSSVLTKADTKVAKEKFAEKLLVQAFTVPATDNTATRTVNWTMENVVLVVDLLWHMNGGDGARVLGGYLKQVLSDPETAGLCRVRASLGAVARFHTIPIAKDHFLVKSLYPDASIDGESDGYIKLVIKAVALSMQWASFKVLEEAFAKQDKTMISALNELLGSRPCPKFAFDAAQMFIHLATGQKASAVKEHLLICRAYHAIWKQTPWAMLMISTKSAAIIKKLGPFAVQAALVGFNEDYAEYGGVLNSLTPIVEKVRVFCQQDLDINDLQAPVALPAGLKKAVDTTARAVNKIDNDLENIASKICSQFEA